MRNVLYTLRLCWSLRKIRTTSDFTTTKKARSWGSGMEIAKGTNFFQGVAQTYPTENEPRVKLMKASRPFGASLLKQLGWERKKGRRGWRKKEKKTFLTPFQGEINYIDLGTVKSFEVMNYKRMYTQRRDFESHSPGAANVKFKCQNLRLGNEQLETKQNNFYGRTWQ